MTERRVDPPWEFFREASTPSLRSFELSRLNHAANLRKEIGALLDEWMEETASALLARCLLERVEKLRSAPPRLKSRSHRSDDDPLAAIGATARP